MSYFDKTEYMRKLTHFDDVGLDDERAKLSNVLRTVSQEYFDREQTIGLLMSQIDLVDQEKSWREQEKKKGSPF